MQTALWRRQSRSLTLRVPPRMVVSIFVVAFGIALICGPKIAAAQGAPTIEELVSHFKCYKVRVPIGHLTAPPPSMTPPATARVTLDDQFTDRTQTFVLRLVQLCNPVEKTHGPDVFPIPEGLGLVHLACYEIREVRPQEFEPEHFVVNQFGTQQDFTVLHPETLCVPSLKDVRPEG